MKDIIIQINQPAHNQAYYKLGKHSKDLKNLIATITIEILQIPCYKKC